MFRIHFATGQVITEGEIRWSQLAHPVDIAGGRYWVLDEPAAAVEIVTGRLTHRLDLAAPCFLLYHYDRVAMPVRSGGLGDPVVLYRTFGVVLPDPLNHRLELRLYPDGRVHVLIEACLRGVADAS